MHPRYSNIANINIPGVTKYSETMGGNLMYLWPLIYQHVYLTSEDKRAYIAKQNTAYELYFISEVMDMHDPDLRAEISKSFANRNQTYDKDISIECQELLRTLCEEQPLTPEWMAAYPKGTTLDPKLVSDRCTYIPLDGLETLSSGEA